MPTSNSLNISSSGLVKFDGTATFSAVTTTQYNTLVGATSNGIASIAPSATSGVPLISQGASANPVYGTAVVAGGGTGQTTLTQYGVLVGAGTSPIAQLATGSSGQVLQSGGASANPAWSTATYPATAGTSGNVLTSDGTNWLSSAAPSGSVSVATGTLTSSQIKSINSSAVALVAAQGVGKAIIPLQLIIKLNYGSNVFVAGSGQQIRLYYGTSILLGTAVGNSVITSSSNRMAYTSAFTYTDNAASSTQNVALNFYTTDSAITGNASNDSTITWQLMYVVVTL